MGGLARSPSVVSIGRIGIVLLGATGCSVLVDMGPFVGGSARDAGADVGSDALRTDAQPPLDAAAEAKVDAPVAAPESLFATMTPAREDLNDNATYELGLKFDVATRGTVRAVRFYKSKSEVGAHVGRLWSAGGAPLAAAAFVGETAGGWQEVRLSPPIAVTPGASYVVSVNCNGFYVSTLDAFATPVRRGNLSVGVGGGLFDPLGTLPTQTFRNSNYFVDLVFVAD